MLFMSKGQNYKLFAIQEEYRWLDGQREKIKEGYIVEFQRVRALHPWEEEQARKVFRFRGLQYMQDLVTPIDPVKQRVSLFDTNWVPEHIRGEVEKILLEHPANGEDYVLVEKPVLTAPWPKYDDLVETDTRDIQTVAEQIALMADAQGHDVTKVKDYERQTLNRREVLDELDKIGATAPEIEVTA